MLLAFHKPIQSWLEVAAEAKNETNPKKLFELVEKLCEALETIRLERENAFVESKKRARFTAA